MSLIARFGVDTKQNVIDGRLFIARACVRKNALAKIKHVRGVELMQLVCSHDQSSGAQQVHLHCKAESGSNSSMILP